MSKTFLEYLRRVEVQFRCKDSTSHRDDDRRLYVYCRLQTISDNCKAKFTCLQTADILNAAYLRDIANGEAWWRS